MGLKSSIVVGGIYRTNRGGNIMVIDYKDRENVIVLFLSTGTTKRTSAAQIRRGTVKDPMSRTVFGVGFIGSGPYKVTKGGVKTESYEKWHHMMERCYSDKFIKKNPTYYGCKVCEEWHDFQNFSKWYYENPNSGKGLHLDKDILGSGKLYSPSTCALVTREDNNIKARAKIWLFVRPDGVIVEIYNLSRFCRENGLDCSNMQNLHSGKIKSCKGWRRVE